MTSLALEPRTSQFRALLDGRSDREIPRTAATFDWLRIQGWASTGAREPAESSASGLRGMVATFQMSSMSGSSAIHFTVSRLFMPPPADRLIAVPSLSGSTGSNCGALRHSKASAAATSVADQRLAPGSRGVSIRHRKRRHQRFRVLLGSCPSSEEPRAHVVSVPLCPAWETARATSAPTPRADFRNRAALPRGYPDELAASLAARAWFSAEVQFFDESFALTCSSW